MDPSSGSIAVAVHTAVLPVVTPLFGEIDTLDTLGALLSSETDTELALAVAPLLSVALALQVIVSPGPTVDGESCQVAPVLDAPPDEDHTYDTLSVPSLVSVADALHVNKLDVVILVVGVIWAAVIVGPVLVTVAKAVAESTPP